MKIRSLKQFLLFLGMGIACLSAGDLRAEEHGGQSLKEHPGAEVEKKQPIKTIVNFSEKQVKKAIRDHIRHVSVTQVMTLRDDKTEEVLKLRFVKIHDPVRKLKNGMYFACTDFHIDGQQKKVYDIDFWLKPEDDKLLVTETKVHKHPVEKKKGKWEKEARYTFTGDEIVPLN